MRLAVSMTILLLLSALPGVMAQEAALGSPWQAVGRDNICGVSNPRQVTFPALVDYRTALAAAPEMKDLKHRGIDPRSAEGQIMRQKAVDHVRRVGSKIMRKHGHCSLWKKISHRDGREIRDLTGEIVAALSLSPASMSKEVAAALREASHPVDSMRLDGMIGWIDDGAVFRDGRRSKRSLSEEEQRMDRSAILDMAIDQAAAEDKLVLWYIYRVVEDESKGRQMYRAPILDVYMRQVVFGDNDVADIMDGRFIPVRTVCDEALCERFGIRPLEFIEPAVVFLDGEGEVVHSVERIRTFDAPWFASLLRRVLDHAGYRPETGDMGVEELTRLGLYEAAYDSLAGAESMDIEQRIESAALARRLRRPEVALEHLSSARALLAEEEAAARDSQDPDANGRRGPAPGAQKRKEIMAMIDYEEGLVLTMQGNRLDTITLLDNAFRGGIADAGYLLALNRLSLGDESGAMRQFSLVAQRHPDSLAGQKALANTTLGPDDRPVGAAFSGFEHVGYLPEAAYEGLAEDTTWAGEAGSPKDIALRGVQFLLSMQRTDGGFSDCRYAYWGSSKITPNSWVAITALSCTALLESRSMFAGEVDIAAIDEALERGEGYLFDPQRLNRGENEDVYADAYRIQYLARVIQLRPEAEDWARAKAEAIISEAQGRQGENGFFAHEYRNAFCTGAMMWALLEAREVGVDVPDEMIAKGSEALESARYENGAYSYGGSARDGREGSLKDAAGRMPICEGVQLRLGKGSSERLELALVNFWEYFDRLEAVRRNDFHSDGELAGFFFSHDLMHTSQVIGLAPEKLGDPMRARLLEVLQQIPEIDGSYIDSHEFGRSYATAMALMTLHRVVRPEEGASAR